MDRQKTENGRKVYDYYADDCNSVQWATDWVDFILNPGSPAYLDNIMDKWYNWCDEFASYQVMTDGYLVEHLNLDKAELLEL